MRFAILGLLSFAFSVIAQTSAPTYAVGDRWVFRYEGPGASSRIRRAEITAVDGNGVTLGWGREKRVVERRSSLLNDLDTEGTEVVKVRHPLSVGDSWDSQWKWNSSDSGPGSTKVNRRVVSLERLRIGSQELDCYRIRATGNWDGNFASPLGSNGRVTEEYWYSPAAKTIVKYQATSWHAKDITYEHRYELVEAHVGETKIK